MTDWLLGTLTATSLLIVLVLLVREPVRQRFGSRVAYGLWLLPAARLFMPTLTQTVERTVPAASPVQPLIQPVADEPLLLTNMTPAGSTLFEQLGGWPTMLVVAWLAVAVSLFVSRMLAFHRDRLAILDGSLELGRLGSVRVVRSREVSSPIAFGIFDRVIAVPVAFENLYDERERAFALEHELAHHRSGDLVANFFAFVLLCLQWFNPLAWVAHAAFRFDQEAACDARVLDKAKARDRADYGRTIAKAASGRALLFASALDRRNTLKRRLNSMLNRSSTGRRAAGKMIILAATALALPLTATRAVEYVDTVPPPPAVPDAPVAPLVPAVLAVQPVAAVAPAAPSPASPPTLPSGVTLGKGDVAFLSDDRVILNGAAKRLEQLSPRERSQLRAALARSKKDLAREMAELPERLAEARREIDRLRSGAAKREWVRDREDLRRDLAEIDREAAELRRAGEDPEKLKAEIRQALREVEAIDIDRQVREALAEIDPDRIAAEVREAQMQMQRMLARLDELDRGAAN